MVHLMELGLKVEKVVEVEVEVEAEGLV